MGEHIVGGTRRVEGGTSWDLLYAVHLEELRVESLLLVVGETGLPWLKLILLKKCLVRHVDLDVK